MQLCVKKSSWWNGNSIRRSKISCVKNILHKWTFQWKGLFKHDIVQILYPGYEGTRDKFPYIISLLGSDYISLVYWNETLSRFSGIPVVFHAQCFLPSVSCQVVHVFYVQCFMLLSGSKSYVPWLVFYVQCFSVPCPVCHCCSFQPSMYPVLHV